MVSKKTLAYFPGKAAWLVYFWQESKFLVKNCNVLLHFYLVLIFLSSIRQFWIWNWVELYEMHFSKVEPKVFPRRAKIDFFIAFLCQLCIVLARIDSDNVIWNGTTPLFNIGSSRYLVDARWFKQLKKYLGIDHDISALGESNATNHPGPIDNGPLFKEDPEQPGEIRDGLIDELEYILLPDECWKVLVEEFKLTDGQDPIARKVLESRIMFWKNPIE